MKKNDALKTVRKKPYPFGVLLKVGEVAQPLRTQAMKMTTIGMLVKLTSQLHFKVGTNVELEFDVPTFGHTVKTAAKVIKTYDAIKGDSVEKLGKEYLLEVHFKNIQAKDVECIDNFLAKIGQKK